MRFSSRILPNVFSPLVDVEDPVEAFCRIRGGVRRGPARAQMSAVESNRKR